MSELVERWVSSDKLLTISKDKGLIFIDTGRVSFALDPNGFYISSIDNNFYLSHIEPTPNIYLKDNVEAKKVSQLLNCDINLDDSTVLIQ